MSMTMAARAHSGASLSAPVRRAQSSRRKASSWFGRLARLAGRRPGRALVLAAFGIVSLAIVANALMFQKARHPAPMLSSTTPVAPPRAAAERRAEPAPAQAPAALPVRPPARPSDLTQVQPAREAQPRPPAPVAAPRAAQAAPAPRAAPARDPIADLINGDIRPPAEIRAANRSAAAPRRTAEN